MKGITPLSLRRCSSIRNALFGVSILALTACGGGGGGGAPSPAPSNTSLPSTENTIDVDTEPTTALADNPVSSSASFDNYQTVSFEIDMADYPMNGERRFLKVYTSSEMLFLGEVSSSGVFSLPLSHKQSQSIFYFDLFSESALDQTISSEVSL